MTLHLLCAVLMLSAASTTSAPAGARLPAPRAKQAATPVARVANANQAATEQPAAPFFVNAAQIYPWRESAIYQVYAAPGIVTDIALQPGEALIAVAAGDTVRWVIGDTTSGSGETRRTHVLVKPIASGLLTNLVITTDRRTYLIRLVATASTAMASLSWTYPADALLALRGTPQPAPPPQPPVADEPAIERLNFGYAISGDVPAWRPVRAFDDGRHTYLEFPPGVETSEAPPLFVVGESGAPELVNYRMHGRFYVVDRIFDAAELRLGTKKRQVVRIERITAREKRAERRS